MTSGGIAFGVVTWAADRRYKNQEKLEAIRQESAEKIELLKKQMTDASIEHIRLLMGDIQDRVGHWEKIQASYSKTTADRFHSLELSVQGFTREVGLLSEQSKQQVRAMALIWKTVVKEIAPGVLRVSERKSEDDK